MKQLVKSQIHWASSPIFFCGEVYYFVLFDGAGWRGPLSSRRRLRGLTFFRKVVEDDDVDKRYL